jgi:hypothetical protein
VFSAGKERLPAPGSCARSLASCGLNNISDLIPLPTERGVALSASQIYRLVGDKPERTSFTVLGTLIDTLD